MGAIQKFFERWGFVRARDYGLLLTPDRRLLATRPNILDDGLGGKIVGWRDSDLAAAELEPWNPDRPGTPRILRETRQPLATVTPRSIAIEPTPTVPRSEPAPAT